VHWRARRCGLGWKPAGMHAGSNDSWQNCNLSCGLETQPRSVEASTQAEDGSPGANDPTFAAGRPLPADLVPSWENRDLRQLLWHRHRLVQARTRMMNQLQAVALNEGLRCK
jgi:hypothetical protein